MTLKERIAHYLACGVKPADIAEICGCSPSYISQLLKDEDYRAAVEQAMKERPVEEDTALDAKYQTLEHKIVSAMSVAVDGAELPHLTRALEATSRAADMRLKRANPALAGDKAATVNVISIMLPAHAIAPPKPLTLNAQSEVVAIGDRPLAPLGAEGVKNLFRKLQEKDSQQPKGEKNVKLGSEGEVGSTIPPDF